MVDEQATPLRRLLFLAYYFPPAPAVAAVRTWSQAKYLSRLGWSVTVVTPDPGVWARPDDVSAACQACTAEGVQRVHTGHRWRALSPGYLKRAESGAIWLANSLARGAAKRLAVEDEVGWLGPARAACRRFRPGSFDVILASGGPFVSFRLASRLSRQLGCPYVLDYRDLWHGNPHAGAARSERARRLEARMLSDCSHVLTISASMGEYLRAAFSIPTTRHTVLTNGYDPEVLSRIRPHDFGHFAIVYAGVLYPPKRPVDPLLAALSHLESHRDWRFHYYGGSGEYVRDRARAFGLTERVVIHGSVPREEALAAVAGASVVAVITSADDSQDLGTKGIVTGKVFEALGLGSPILLIAPPGGDAEAVVGSNGVRCAGGDPEGIAALLAASLQQRPPRPVPPPEYAWPVLAARLDAVLQGVLATPDGEAFATALGDAGPAAVE